MPYLVENDKNTNKINAITKKPKFMNEMLTCAKKLAQPFPFVRVDFYVNDNKIIFGEMTFSPSACLERYNKK